jgi:hypothetical protein
VYLTDARGEIQEQYDRWSKAYMARDSATLIGILSPDYTLTTSSKTTLTYDVYAAKLRLLKNAAPDPTKYSTSIKKLTLVGDEAEVVSVETMQNTGTNPQTKQPAFSFHRHEYLDRWIHYDSGWCLRRTVTRSESTEWKPLK